MYPILDGLRRARRTSRPLLPRDGGRHDGQMVVGRRGGAVRLGAFSFVAQPRGTDRRLWRRRLDQRLLRPHPCPDTPDAPLATVNIDLSALAAGQEDYPCDVLSGDGSDGEPRKIFVRR